MDPSAASSKSAGGAMAPLKTGAAGAAELAAGLMGPSANRIPSPLSSAAFQSMLSGDSSVWADPAVWAVWPQDGDACWLSSPAPPASSPLLFQPSPSPPAASVFHSLPVLSLSYQLLRLSFQSLSLLQVLFQEFHDFPWLPSSMSSSPSFNPLEGGSSGTGAGGVRLEMASSSMKSGSQLLSGFNSASLSGFLLEGVPAASVAVAVAVAVPASSSEPAPVAAAAAAAWLGVALAKGPLLGKAPGRGVIGAVCKFGVTAALFCSRNSAQGFSDKTSPWTYSILTETNFGLARRLNNTFSPMFFLTSARSPL
mmetsp:Transcript_16701/g.35863  ORF Transcript_16701/g.35863 Transcript_16701/m.35863 type:complete len:310 (-) Transcript_16701:2344-3273(-)